MFGDLKFRHQGGHSHLSFRWGMKSFDAKTYGFLKILRECWGEKSESNNSQKHPDNDKE